MRFVVRYTGEGKLPQQVVDSLQSDSEIRLLDHSGRMLLVEAAEEKLLERFPAGSPWMMSKESDEVRIPKPPRPKPIRRPKGK